MRECGRGSSRSGLFEIAYFALLATAYRRAPLSVVYPIARGGAPVLVLLVGAVALGHTTSWRQAAAVVLVVVGILLVRGLRSADTIGVLLGLAIASCIAGYTLIDKRGIAYAGPIPYLELSMLGAGCGLRGRRAAREGPGGRARRRRPARRSSPGSRPSARMRSCSPRSSVPRPPRSPPCARRAS